jgi:hypothetical protein
MAHHDQIVAAIGELATIDSNRRGYYDDVKSKYEWEWAVCGSTEAGPPSGALDMSCVCPVSLPRGMGYQPQPELTPAMPPLFSRFAEANR